MNYDIVNVLSAYSDIEQAFESMTESEKNLNEVTNLMNHVDELVLEVKSFGFTDTSNYLLLNQKHIGELANLSVDKIIRFESIESLDNGSSSAFKKFVQSIKDFVQKIVVFLQKLFNTFTNKCRTLVMNIQNIQMDKKVNTLTKDKFAKILLVTKESRDFCNKYINLSIIPFIGKSINYVKDTKSVISDLVNHSYGVFKSNSEYNISVDNSIFEFAESTLGDAGWAINDAEKLVNAYMGYNDHYTRIGAVFNRMMVEYAILDINEYGDKGKDIRTSLRLDAVVYGLLSKIQHAQARQILAFYKCLGPGVKLADGDDGHFLTYKESA